MGRGRAGEQELLLLAKNKAKHHLHHLSISFAKGR